MAAGLSLIIIFMGGIYGVYPQSEVPDPVQISHTPPILFTYKGDSYLQYRSWVLAVTLNITRYGLMLKQVRIEVEKFESAISELESQSPIWRDSKLLGMDAESRSHTNSTVFHLSHTAVVMSARSHAMQMKAEISSLQFMYNRMEAIYLSDGQPSTYDSTQFDLMEMHRFGRSFSSTNETEPQKVFKRDAIFSWFGALLGTVIGLKNHHDLKNMKKQLKILSDKNQWLASAMEENLSILKDTRVTVAENSEAISELQDGIIYLKSVVEDMYSTLKMSHEREIVYSQVLDAVIISISSAHSLLRQTQTELLVVRDQLTTACQGTLPLDLVSTTDLQHFAEHLRRKLTDDFVLPFTDSDLLGLYRALPVTVISSTKEVFILINFPIARRSEKFELYKLHQVPFPYENQPDLALKYAVEGNALAISSDRSRFKLLNEYQFAQCSAKYVTHCHIPGATYMISDSNLCLTALFSKRQDKIDEQCNSEVLKTNRLPIVEDLGGGVFLIYTKSPLQFEFKCNAIRGEEKDVQIETLTPGNHLVQLKYGCEGISHSVVLPAFVSGNYSVNAHTERLDLEIWRNLKLSYFSNHDTNDRITLDDHLFEFTKIKGLDVRDDERIDKLKQKLQKFANEKDQHSSISLWDLILIIIIVIIVLMSIVAIATLYLYGKKNGWWIFCDFAKKINGSPQLTDMFKDFKEPELYTEILPQPIYDVPRRTKRSLPDLRPVEGSPPTKRPRKIHANQQDIELSNFALVRAPGCPTQNS